MKCVALCLGLALMIGGALGLDHTDWNFITTVYDGRKVNGVLGINRRSMLMIPDAVTDPSKCNKRTINNHDFEKHLVAIKDPEKRECMVKPLGKRETYDRTKKALDNGSEFIQTMEHWAMPDSPLPKDRVEREIGSMLADFCSDSVVYMLKRATNIQLMRTKRCVVCLWCKSKIATDK
ncbi:uncharacterized protein LOC121386369 [Gigantopelta aegis]|uniref:uncharacterized protein LOC121386369 n=1 Tax=Gigantopelta aegis TaxID=1735272 RepID=UPI001B88D2C2|nr:uncharacterized protein LOC121386369 [Gigantopelta aegis]